MILHTNLYALKQHMHYALTIWVFLCVILQIVYMYNFHFLIV